MIHGAVHNLGGMFHIILSFSTRACGKKALRGRRKALDSGRQLAKAGFWATSVGGGPRHQKWP